jgi:uncharacterized protein YjbI with pentapeptide repeats
VHYFASLLGISATAATVHQADATYTAGGVAISIAVAVGWRWLVNHPLNPIDPAYDAVADSKMCWPALTRHLCNENRQCFRQADNFNSSRGRMRLLPAILALTVLSAGSAAASCRDYPGPGIDWSGCDKSRRLLTEDDLHGANLARADLSHTDLSGANLSQATLSEATMSRARLDGANLKGADLTKAMLVRVDLRGADLSGAIAYKAELHRADLSEAVLVGTNLEKAELGRARLIRADLTNALLIRAYLARADLRGARVAGADLTEAELDLADVRGTDLSQTKGLMQEQISETCGDSTTKLPSGLRPPQGWPCTRTEAED